MYEPCRFGDRHRSLRHGHRHFGVRPRPASPAVDRPTLGGVVPGGRKPAARRPRARGREGSGATVPLPSGAVRGRRRGAAETGPPREVPRGRSVPTRTSPARWRRCSRTSAHVSTPRGRRVIVSNLRRVGGNMVPASPLRRQRVRRSGSGKPRRASGIRRPATVRGCHGSSGGARPRGRAAHRAVDGEGAEACGDAGTATVRGTRLWRVCALVRKRGVCGETVVHRR